jgi:hypothetical protein
MEALSGVDLLLRPAQAMKTTEPTNPYTPSATTFAMPPDRHAIRIRTWIGLAVGVLVLAGDLLVAIRIPYLFMRYPDLDDRSAGPVYYWPSLEVEISTMVLAVTVPVCLAILIPSLLSFRRQCGSPTGSE